MTLGSPFISEFSYEEKPIIGEDTFFLVDNGSILVEIKTTFKLDIFTKVSL